MRVLPFFADPDTREDILDHISGYVFDRAQLSMADEPMRPRFASINERMRERTVERKRSVRR
jgi:hypothetical protein